VSLDFRIEFSNLDTTAVWSDSVVTDAAPPNSLWTSLVDQPTQMTPWGISAINPNPDKGHLATTVVYVIDQGIGRHEDLNVVEWVSAVDHTLDCGTRGIPGLSGCSTAQYRNLIACEAHSTMVAGIIGAVNNSKGVRGVDAGVQLVSVSVLAPTSTTNTHCVTNSAPEVSGNNQATRSLAALDWVASDIQANNHTGKPSVINMSFNWITPTNWPAIDVSNFTDKIRRVAANEFPPGAFIVQSAGNKFKDACLYAYNPPQPPALDGIMVVGAINNHGQPVVPLNSVTGFWKDLSTADGAIGHEEGSDFGPCVEAWAPGDAVYTTAAPPAAQLGDVPPYTKYGYGSGTSFSAPHIAGLAAYVIDGMASGTTPFQVEQAMQQLSVPLGSVDHDDLSISLPTRTPAAASSTPYAEFLISTTCLHREDQGPPPAHCFVLHPDADAPSSTSARNRGTLSLGSNTNIYALFEVYGSGIGCDIRKKTGAGSVVWGNGYHILPPTFLPAATGQGLYSTFCDSASVDIGP
jgi:subtilisin family serine protease